MARGTAWRMQAIIQPVIPATLRFSLSPSSTVLTGPLLLGYPITIRGGIDPLVFTISNLSGYAVDENNNPVPVIVAYPLNSLTAQTLSKNIPSVMVKEIDRTVTILNIGGYRYRWFDTIELQCYGRTPQQRYAIETSIRERILAIAKSPQFYNKSNYIFMYVQRHTIVDEVQMFGQPLYRAFLTLYLIYDIVTPLPQYLSA
jgi:hypothetical protein